MTMHGSLVAVSDRTMGDLFAVAASIGDTTLFLNDVSDFDELGGSVSIAGTVYAYDSADMDADTIHLTSTLAAAAAVGDEVDIWDVDLGAVVSETVALVSIEDQDGDPISAVVEHALTPLIANGTLITGQSVSLTPDGAAHRLTAVHGRTNQVLQRSTNVGVQMGIDDNAGGIHGITVTPGGTVVAALTLGDFRVRDAASSAFMPCLASAFTVSSDARLKTKPTKAPDALAIIKAAPAKHWRYLTDADDVKRIGPMAGDLPDWARETDTEDGTHGIDLARMSGLHHRAIEQLLARIEALETELTKLKER